MVFEKFVVHLLDKYLSEYIENLDYTKLKIDMWSGNVVLENLSFKPNALADLNLPVTIKIGYLQKLTLQIPWQNLYTNPTKLTIDGLYILVIPKIEVEYDGKQDENDQHKAKMKEVDKIEQLRKSKEDLETKENIEQTNDTFGARMKLQIIQNLELSINNIHIAYEDKTTKPNHPFAFGITLNSIIFQTTNQQWVPTIIAESTPVIYKLGELKALSVYWNTNIKSNSNEILKNLQSTIAIDNKQPPKDMSYIFQPLNVKAKLIMTLKPRQQNFEKPMFHITIDLEHISLNLNRAQYLDILDLLEYQDHLTAKLKHIKYRPKKFDNPRQKWKFAYNAIVNEKIKPRFECYKWKNIKLHSKYCKEYHYIYFQELIGKITDEQKQRAEELEKKLDVFNLTYIRRRTQIEAKKKKEQEPKSFLSSISSWWNNTSNQVDPELDLKKVVSDEEKKFYETIGYQGEDTSTLTYPKEYIDIDLTIRFIMVDLNIWSKINEHDQQFRIISRASLPDTEFIFRRRPAASSALFLVNLGSFQVFGIPTNIDQSNENRPILIQPVLSNNSKLLQAEFEINPLNKDSGYRLKILSQSLEIKHDRPTTIKLIECFENDTRHNLQGVKQAAYMTYTDVKHQTKLLVEQNIEKVKVLDIYIDLQSTYFLFPENGVYYDDCPVICVDTGHLVFQQKNTKEESMDNYTQFRLELKNFQLLYAAKYENWRSARQEENTRLHLIKPITLYTNIFKCIYTDNTDFSAWKISGKIPAINIKISDTRLFKIMKHIQSFELPQSKKTIDEQTELWITTPTTQQTFETIEILTNEKKTNTQIEANFELSKIDLLLEEEKDDKDYPFLRISFISIYTQMFIKTFNIEFQISLDNLIIFHEQFITNNNHYLRFLAAQYEENEINTEKLVTININHTSSESNEVENKIRIHFSKLIVTLQLEALLSLMRFQDNIMLKWPKDIFQEQIIVPEENKKISKIEKFVKENTSSSSTTLQIEADLEEFRIVIAKIHTQIFDVHIQGVKADMHNTSDQTFVNLILTDLCIFDPNINARYQKIISQQNGGSELLSVSMILFNYPKNHTKALNDVDCSIKINFAKANITFLYKYIDQMMEFLDILNISKAALEIASYQTDIVYEQVQKLQNQTFKLSLNATFNAPNIIVPINSSSNEALFLDLGRLIIQTNFIDDTKKLLVEQQKVIIENIHASRVKLNKTNEIESEIILLKCAELKMDINRLLYSEILKTEPNISIKMQWDLIHLRLAKDDYLCVMKILTENFRDQTITNVTREQYGYQHEQQKREEDALRTAVIEKQKKRQIGEILENIKIRAEIKKLAFTLYLGETNFINRRVQHNENLKLANVEIDIFEIILRQFSDSSYKITTRIKNFLCDDVRETHKTDAVTRMMDRHFTVDPNAYMLIASLDFKPKDEKHPMPARLLTIALESLYICIKLDYLMILRDFFMSNLSIDDTNISKNESNRNDTSSSDIDIDNRVNIIIKNPEIILLQDQRNLNSNCLVFNLTLDLHIINLGNNAKVFGAMKDLTIYTSNFAELKYSKIKYRVLQPAHIELTIIMDSEQQNINVSVSNIIINIAPAALRILIGVTNSLGLEQSTIKQEKFDIQTMFDHKSFNEANFWFLQKKDDEEILSKKKSLMEKENKQIKNSLFEQFFLTITTIEIKVDIGFDLITKSVVAMCLSNWTVDLKNWSNRMTLESTMAIEAALYNEHSLVWEPFIEPTFDKNGKRLLPWSIICSVEPILPDSDRRVAIRTNEQQTKKKVSGLNAKQLITIRTQQLLNITITKTGLNLIKYLSSLFNDIYNQRLPNSTDNNKSMLSLSNFTGQNIFINKLNGLEFTNDITWTSKVLEQNESISLTALSERLSSAYRLSVIEEQTSKNRQEFSLQINNHTKLISINQTRQRIYNLQSSFHSSYPIQVLCDTQIHNNQRRIILSSIIKIFNNTILPIIILDRGLVTGKSFHRIESNQEFYVPIDLLYKNSNSSIFIGMYEDDMGVNDYFTFDWITAKSQEQKLKLKNGKTVHLIVYKEIKEAYSENADQLDRVSYCIYIHSAIQLTNLLPIDVQCSINHVENIDLKPNQSKLITSGNKNSVLKFIIPFYNNLEWISNPVDLGIIKESNSSEQIIIFPNGKQFLRMALHIDIYHESYSLLLYVPFWIVNHTDLKLEFRIGNEKISIKNTDQSFLICPNKYQNNANENGQIGLSNPTNDNKTINWSENFSLDVIKSIGMTSCKGSDDKTYMICVDIRTSSFGLTKMITLSPAMVIINQISIPIEIVETVLGKEQSKWIQIGPDGIIPFWPQNTKEGLMHVRYAHNRKTSKPFSMNKKHQTLLYMNDKERLVIFVEVIATDFDGVRVIFSDYKSGDAPILLVNHTRDQVISFAQKDDADVRYLLPEHFVYYTWMNPLKSREISIACNGKPKNIELSPHCDVLNINGNNVRIKYVVFIDGVQTVLLFSDNDEMFKTALNIKSSTQSICRKLRISIPDVGVSIVNDLIREELLYISFNKSKVIWVEMKKSRVKPFSYNIHKRLEDLYQKNLELIKINPNDQRKYQMNEYREIIFYDNTAEFFSQEGKHKSAKRQSLNGLWIEYTWSMTNTALYACINRVQIDNQLDCTKFPSMVYPVLPKTTGSDMTEKPFIELSIYQTKTVQSNIMHFQYFKLLIQEFALRVDQSLIVAILAFLREEKNAMVPIINMNTDLEHIHQSFRTTIRIQTDTPSGETQMYFENIHLSPLKIHLSFSMHGSNVNEELFDEYPLVGFLLKTLNIAEVQDVILRLGFYERSFNRFTMTKLNNEVSAHYQNQFLKQIHYLVFGLDVLGNPFGIIRGLAEGVESLFYEPYKGAMEGPIEFAEGVATGVLTLVGSTVGTAADAISKITGVIGQSLATLTLDNEYQASRIRRREPADNAVKEIATGGKNVVMGVFNGVTGFFTKPVIGAMNDGVSGFFTGIGRGTIGLVAQPASAIADSTSNILSAVQHTASQEQIIRRIRYPRHIGHNGLVRPYSSHDAMGSYILNQLEEGKYSKTDIYVAHITCLDSTSNWLMATSKRILFITETSFFGNYGTDWVLNYMELNRIPVIIPDKQSIQILVKTSKNTTTSEANQSYGKLVKYQNIADARYFIEKITNAMHSIGL